MPSSQNPLNFTGKVAFFTGAASGIGLATVQALANAGASVDWRDANCRFRIGGGCSQKVDCWRKSLPVMSFGFLRTCDTGMEHRQRPPWRKLPSKRHVVAAPSLGLEKMTDVQCKR
jgi:hypothetical protein